MATEATRLLTLPGRTFMEGMNRGSEQWQKAINEVVPRDRTLSDLVTGAEPSTGEPISVFGYKLPAALSVPLRVAGGLLEGVNAPVTAVTRMVTDPGSRLLQSATGISEPTREMVQGMGDVALGVFGPAGVAKLREVPGAFKPAPPMRARAVEPSAEPVVWDTPAASTADEVLSAARPVEAPAAVGLEEALSRPAVDIGAVPVSETRVSTPMTGAIAGSADAAVAERIAAGPTQRLFRHVQDALAAGEIAPESLPGILERHGVTAADFARDYAQTVSDSGRTLGQLSYLRQRLGVVLANEPEAAQVLAALPDPPVSGFAKAMEWYRTVDDQRRALLVSQWATSARNAISQTGRLGLDSVDNALSAFIGGESTVGSLQAGLDNFAAVARRMTPAGRDRLAGIMNEFPLDAARLAGTISGEATLGSKVSSFINPLNAAQEGFFRKVAFDAKLSTLARERGLNMDALAASPGQIPGDMIEQASKHALEVTFASSPQAGTFGHALLNAYRELPILTTINPFPRFFGNALKFLYEFSPLGITKLLTPAAERTLASGNPAAASQVISRATLGTGMLAAAIAIRATDVGGEKWYELKVPGSDQRLDTRAMGPFNMYLLMAEGIVHPDRLTVADWAKGLVGINRVAGTGLVLTDALTSGSLDQKLQRFYSFVGAYLGGFSVPARNFKAMIEGGLSGSPEVAAEESLYRDQRDSPLTAPFLSNIPGVSQSLPAMVSNTSSEPPRNENPLLRQFSGASIRTKNEAQQLLDTLGIEPSQIQPQSGIPAWDRAIAEPLGSVVEQLLPRISQSPAFSSLPPEIQRYLVRQGLTAARSGARGVAVEAHPDLAAQATLKGLDPDLRDLVGISRQGVQAPGPMDALRRALGMPPSAP
jgi:hypothetical protein